MSIKREYQSDEAIVDEPSNYDITSQSYLTPSKKPMFIKTDCLDQLEKPSTDLVVYDTYCTDMVDDFSNVIEDHGVNLATVEDITNVFDTVR